MLQGREKQVSQEGRPPKSRPPRVRSFLLWDLVVARGGERVCLCDVRMRGMVMGRRRVMGLCARGHLCVSVSVHGPGREGTKTSLGGQGYAQWEHPVPAEGQWALRAAAPGLPSLKTTTGERMHLSLHRSSPHPPPLPPPAPSCFDGRKKFQLFPSLFFQTGDSLGKGIPPSPNHHNTYISMP